jgi:mycothiol synthase
VLSMMALELAVADEPTAALRDAVGALAARVEANLAHAPLSEHQQMVLARNSWRPGESADGRCAAGITATGADAAALLGYAQVAREHTGGEYAVELLVEPVPERAAGVADALLGAVVIQVAEWGGGTVRLWVPKASGSDSTLADAHGFAPERDLIQMRCPLPLPADPPASTEPPPATRAFRPGDDEEAWLVVNNRAFASHPEQGHWDRATLDEREREAWFDPRGFRVLEADGRMAGSCWTKIHSSADPPMGEIYVIGVDPDFHGRGWGRALTRAGLDWLAAEGLSVGMLYVDADNVAAVQLYRSMGFSDDHVDRSFLGTVDPA